MTKSGRMGLLVLEGVEQFLALGDVLGRFGFGFVAEGGGLLDVVQGDEPTGDKAEGEGDDSGIHLE